MHSVPIYKRPAVVAAFIVVVTATALSISWRSTLPEIASEQARPVQAKADEKVGNVAATPKGYAPVNTVRTALVSVDMESRPKYLAQRDIASFARNYSALANAAAKGDAVAARELYENLNLCRSAPRSMAKIDDELGQIAIDSGTASKAYVDAQSSLTKKFQDCAQLSDAQIASYRHWLSEAARLGDAKSKLVYVRSGQPDDPKSPTYLRDSREFEETARAYLEEQLAENNPDALFTASIGHGPGGLLDPDPVDEYAYLYAYILAKGIKNGVLLDQLTEIGAGMTKENVAAATSKGGALYRACCQ